VPIVFCETRQLAEEWTYRFLAAAHAWAETEHASLTLLTPLAVDHTVTELDQAPNAPQPSTAKVRAWARATGLAVPDRGKLRPDIWNAWRPQHLTSCFFRGRVCKRSTCRNAISRSFTPDKSSA